MVDFKECASMIKQKLEERLSLEERKKTTKTEFFKHHGGSKQKYYIRSFNEIEEQMYFASKKLQINLVFILEVCPSGLRERIIDAWKKQPEVKFLPQRGDGTWTFVQIDCGDWETEGLNEDFIETVVDKYAQVIEIHRQFKNELHFEKGKSKPAGNNRSKSANEVLSWNRIYFGAPGTGKSHQLNEEAETKFGKNFERVTFYPTYSYQQFVGSYKPFVSETGNITYRFVFGPLMRLLLKAWEAEEAYQDAREDLDELKSADEKDFAAIKEAEARVRANRFVLVVEELNRAEAAAVFGDFFQLLDRGDNGESVYKIAIPEELKARLEEEGVTQEELYLPANLFIWATMNNADQGVTPLDTAFKRRWEFEYIGLDNGDDKLKAKASEENLWNELRKRINVGLRKLALNEDKLLGPFFMKAKGLTQEAFWKTFCDKVVLYLYEDAARLRRKECFKGSNITYSDLRKKLVKKFNDWEHCKTTLEDVFSFEITNNISEKDWPWPPQAKDGPTGNETDGESPAGESGAQGESTSDNF